MSDIVYTIGAKDQATGPLNKVDSAMGRLEKSTKQLGEVSGKSLTQFSMSIGSLAKAAGVFGAVNLAAKGVQAAWSSFTGALAGASAAYDTQIEAVKGLETSLRLNGEAVDEQSTKLQAFASEMQAYSGVGDEVTLGLMRQASMFGVSADQLDSVTAATIGLAEATGKSLDESLKLVKNSLEGEFGAFGEIIPAIKEAATEEEKLAMIQELSRKGLEAKAESANRLTGAQERASGAVGDLMEQVGALIAPIREVTAIGIKAMAEALTGILVPAVEWVQAKFEEWRPVIMGVIESTVNGIIAGITMAEVIFTNFGAVVGLAFDSIKLRYETYRADTEHLFVTTIPAYGSWFAENFPKFFEDAFSAITTIIQNGATKVAAGFDKLWEFVKSRGKGGLSGLSNSLSEAMSGSLLEGFERSVGALPQVAARAMTDTEKELQASIGNTSGKLATEFAEKFNSRAIKLGGKVGENLAEGIDLALKKSAGDTTESIEKDLSTLAQSESKRSLSDSKLTASEGRLLTRGQGERKQDPSVSLEIIAKNAVASSATLMEVESELRQIKEQMQQNPIVVAPNP